MFLLFQEPGACSLVQCNLFLVSTLRHGFIEHCRKPDFGERRKGVKIRFTEGRSLKGWREEGKSVRSGTNESDLQLERETKTVEQ